MFTYIHDDEVKTIKTYKNKQKLGVLVVVVSRTRILVCDVDMNMYVCLYVSHVYVIAYKYLCVSKFNFCCYIALRVFSHIFYTYTHTGVHTDKLVNV